MTADFDQLIDRKGTWSLKYDFAVQRGRPADILPLWVADMDFKTPQCVTEALVKVSEHGIFGYSESGTDYSDTLKAWFLERFGWHIQPEWLVKTPGIVFAIAAAIRAFTKEGEAVLIQEPVYYPFRETIVQNGRTLVVNELLYDGASYSIDFEDFERKIREQKVRLFVLCSPHNPVGRVWRREELLRLGAICKKYGVLVVADEIHADFVYPGNTHAVFSAVHPDFEAMTITCTAPTKTFNLAGLQVSNIFVPNPALRDPFKQELERTGYSQLGIMGLVACKAAYEGGQAWLFELQQYLAGNLAFLRAAVTEKLPGVTLVEPEGTYLVWLDFRQLGLGAEALEDLIVQRAGLWLDRGEMFGPSGAGFQRINIACPRPVLEKAITQLAQALKAPFERSCQRS